MSMKNVAGITALDLLWLNSTMNLQQLISLTDLLGFVKNEFGEIFDIQLLRYVPGRYSCGEEAVHISLTKFVGYARTRP